MALEFIHATLGQRVLFGTGKAAGNVAAELDRLGTTRPMVIASASGWPLAETVLSDVASVLWWDEVVQHVPVKIAERARSAAAEHRADVLISVGGGSTTGLAKAVALTTGIPIIAVPTTYAGSEATNVRGMTEDRTKRTGLDNRALPAAVVYDANLSRTLPVRLSVASGLNGLAHCIDSLWAPRTDPINQALALEGAWALNRALPHAPTHAGVLPYGARATWHPSHLGTTRDAEIRRVICSTNAIESLNARYRPSSAAADRG